ncbi:hypothetical protein BLJAPNOD_04614 [Ensifer sp. M14]|uniref:hypothetical protein n=1 Tax=Sinorhizobium/Ensifer group TaxID=227292 RepID=UPI000985C896|nr:MULTISPECIES: hypothetical protein [Sinorhizobium/Ensifer group]OOG70294.1 hypothetical protein B0E45_14040 [Sinorhizobium sp. A49]RDL48339.1 hypothetical protein BLJAPNOD_04614 [Ensifer sp. M14]
MRHSALKILSAISILSFYGCESASTSTPAPAPTPVPAATVLVGSGAPITAGNMPAFCRGEVAGQYATKPAYVKTGAPMKQADGSTMIDGTVDKGSEGVKAFRCRFDTKGAFVDVMAMTSDGAL